MKTLRQTSAQTPVAATRPEIELLLCCARTNVDNKTAEQIRILLQKSIDWAYLIHTASQQGVVPFLYSSLNAICPEVVPQAILAKLQTLFQANAAHNRFLTSQLLELLNLFEENNIPIIPFKGSVLAVAAYGDLALRQFSDLDILLRQSDILKAKKLLLVEGYRMKIERIKVTQEQKAMFVQSSQIYNLIREAVYPFVHPQKGILVELHWGIVPPYFCFFIDDEGIWDDLETVFIANKNVPNLPPEKMLLTIIAHGTKDCWKQLARVCDVAAIVGNYPQLNWEKLIELARVKGGQRMLFLGLMLAHNLLELPIPESVWRKIRADSKVELLAENFSQRLFGKTEGYYQDGTITHFHLRTRERLRDRVKYLLRLIFMPTTSDWLLFPRSEFPVFIYYLLRPIRLIKIHLIVRLAGVFRSKC